MKAATIDEIKQELQHNTQAKLVELCIRLSKYKKENKELLTYLLFEAHDEQGYVQGIKEEMDDMFDEVNKTNVYYAKKSLRKILRIAGKYIRYSSSKQTEVELLLYFLFKLKNSGIRYKQNTVILNMYNNQSAKIKKLIAALHEDLQYEYMKELEELQ